MIEATIKLTIAFRTWASALSFAVSRVWSCRRDCEGLGVMNLPPMSIPQIPSSEPIGELIPIWHVTAITARRWSRKLVRYVLTFVHFFLVIRIDWECSRTGWSDRSVDGTCFFFLVPHRCFGWLEIIMNLPFQSGSSAQIRPARVCWAAKIVNLMIEGKAWLVSNPACAKPYSFYSAHHILPP